MVANKTKVELEKANNKVQTTLTEVIKRLTSILNAIKGEGEVRDSNIKEIRSVATMLGGLVERYPTARSKKEMSTDEFLDYARGQLAKAMSEGDQAGPRLIALKEVLSDATEVMKQIVGAAEDTESVRVQVEIYEEPGLTEKPQEKSEEEPVQMPEAKSIEDLLTKVEELCKDVQKADTGTQGRSGQGLGPGGECACPKCGTQLKHETGQACNDQVCPKCGAKMMRTVSKVWPADMSLPAEKPEVQKGKDGDLSWGLDPAEVRDPSKQARSG